MCVLKSGSLEMFVSVSVKINVEQYHKQKLVEWHSVTRTSGKTRLYNFSIFPLYTAQLGEHWGNYVQQLEYDFLIFYKSADLNIYSIM